MNLRQMTMSDADFMLEMKNEPETRRFAIVSKEEITREAHMEWLGKNIQYFRIIRGTSLAEIIHNLNEEFSGEDKQEKDSRVGAIRVQDGEISVWIHRDHRGNGFAAQAINEVKRDGMTAKILPGNISSIRAFLKARFKPIEFVDNLYFVFRYEEAITYPRVFLIGHPGSQKIVKASRHLTKKYLPMCDVIYVNHEAHIDNWAKNIAKYLDGLQYEDYIIFGLDDYLLRDRVNLKVFREAVQKMNWQRYRGEVVANIKLCECTPEEHEEYPCTTQYSIWRRDILVEMLRHPDIRTPWDFELIGSALLKEHSWQKALNYPCIPYFTNSCLSSRWEGVRFDGLNDEDIQYIKQNNLIL